MNLKNLENKVHKNGFPEDERNCFTAKVGELLPVFSKFLYPNKKVKIKAKNFTRTTPLNTAAYTRVREYYDYFFVPLRLLWRYSDQYFIQMRDSYVANNMDSTSDGFVEKAPYMDLLELHQSLNALYDNFHNLSNSYTDVARDVFNQPRYATIAKLLEYLDYGIYDPDTFGEHIPFSAVNLWRLLAYQKIYYDYFRLPQWEKNKASNYNLDYIAPHNIGYYSSNFAQHILDSTDTMFELRYANYNKDMFTGLLPSPQYGETSTVTINGAGQTYLDLRQENGTTIQNSSYSFFPAQSETKGVLGVKNGSGTPSGYLTRLNLEGQIGNLSILALRQSEALQKWKEIALSGNEDYRTQIRKHFGIDPGSVRSSLCEHLGGFQSNIVINEVINQNLADDNAADIAGRGISSSDGFIEFEAKEHGILMCIYHAKPLLDYAAVGIAPDNLKLAPTDYVIPEFDKIGMQPVPTVWLRGYYDFEGVGIDELKGTLGYAPRYIEYKTSIDKVRGGFLRSFNTWVAPWSEKYITDMFRTNFANTGQAFNYLSFKVSPSALDSIFAVSHDAYPDTRSDHFICCLDTECTSVQPIDRDGLPY